jgi:hypothetical protein
MLHENKTQKEMPHLSAPDGVIAEENSMLKDKLLQ